ncbi:hypothetical protein CORC01_12358 [Colletotrichum orchidophilum]|uniref:Uncharacterized protein n=1 Tax=Colletotrichum orchidophilum TaxID=1209926 RepID=A0A1G4ATE6_9PEZI|nr:uncharacterized protein CORC01_12358 [Colletotrichum orchidophilum]OHE92363.1 hypothetical protein CORC01_12358 [Colletotrichum orchidophilum]
MEGNRCREQARNIACVRTPHAADARNLYGLGAGCLRHAMYRSTSDRAKRYITRRTVQSPWTKETST